MMKMMDTEQIIKIGKALSDQNRVEIMKLLSEEELCACHILEQFEIAQSTLSHHMKQLTDSTLVNVTKKGKWCYYSINPDTIDSFKEFLDTYKDTENKNQCGCQTKCD